MEVAAAKVNYEIVVENGQMTCTSDGKTVKKSYLSVVQEDEVYTVVKPCSENSVIYYFDKNGQGTVYNGTGFIKVIYNGVRNTYYAKKVRC